jgi:flagella basal body P-ring formation protein FlgA
MWQCPAHSNTQNNAQSLATIEHAAVEFIKQQHPADAILNVNLQRLDKRLKLSRCDNDLLVNWSPGSKQIGRTTVNVACTAPKPWRIFVRATVEKDVLAWVLNNSVRKGEVLSRQLVSQQSIMLGNSALLAQPNGAPISEIEPWIGQVFARAVQAGRVLTDQSLQLPMLVTKGESVSITYQSAQLAIKTKGVALESGSLEQKISVKNTESNKVFDAIVVGRSNVTILR